MIKHDAIRFSVVVDASAAVTAAAESEVADDDSFWINAMLIDSRCRPSVVGNDPRLGRPSQLLL